MKIVFDQKFSFAGSFLSSREKPCEAERHYASVNLPSGSFPRYQVFAESHFEDHCKSSRSGSFSFRSPLPSPRHRPLGPTVEGQPKVGVVSTGQSFHHVLEFLEHEKSTKINCIAGHAHNCGLDLLKFRMASGNQHRSIVWVVLTISKNEFLARHRAEALSHFHRVRFTLDATEPNRRVDLQTSYLVGEFDGLLSKRFGWIRYLRIVAAKDQRGSSRAVIARSFIRCLFETGFSLRVPTRLFQCCDGNNALSEFSRRSRGVLLSRSKILPGWCDPRIRRAKFDNPESIC